MNLCLCNSGKLYAECCERYLENKEIPKTALELMRSRYSAYILNDVAYILKTHHPDTVMEVSPKALEEWVKSTKWLNLDIIKLKGGSEKDNEGIVEFKASYIQNETEKIHHEKSQFLKLDGVWFYHNYLNLPIASNKKAGRNDPCVCGSGKKYKKCCGK